MKLKVNSKETEVKDGCTVAELASQLALPEKGIAIAVNNKMTPRTEWNERILQPNDSLVVIKAACGG
ncbi:sulfur carrier protein ThiS [Phocaeicola faecalis]|jgi:sulfur carrier protein|uniref:sulfur carrier protein ThiS n=1 Tax=Phocaeicola faecalis TaxID=2786956 RepID=UPI001F004BE7|nr:sulfur carrier protein ThiS [Phocaeicola faecalis]